MSLFHSGAGRLCPPLVILLLVSNAAYGADDGASGKEHREVEAVQVTATRTEANKQDIAAAVTTISQERVRAESPDVLPEILRGLPGTYFQQTTPGQGIPIIRGLKGSQILHLVDGMRVNNAFFRDAPNQYLGLIDAFAVERVEVVRGASGSLYGADAMGGVVNFLTPEVSYEGSQWQSDSTVYSTWNSADDGLVVRAETRAGKSGYGFTGGVSWQDHSDRETGNGTTAGPSGYRSKAGDLKWTADLGSTAELMLSAQFLEQPSTPRTDELVAGFGQDHPASDQFLFEPNSRSFLHARFRSQSLRSWLDSFQVNVSRQVITDDRLTQDFEDPDISTEQNESVLNGLTLQFDKDSTSGTHLSWGLEYYADTVRSSRYETNETSGTVSEVPSRFPDHSGMDAVAAYFSAEWAAGRRSTLGGGLRYSRTKLALPTTESSTSVDLEPDDFTGDLHWVHALNPKLNLLGNIGRGFRPPNIFDLGTLGNRPGNRFNITNPDLRAETVYSYDLGLKSHSGDWQSELYIFYLDYRDKISSVATGDFTESGRMVVRSENLGKVSLYGVEAGFRWFSDSEHEVYGTLNYTRGEESTNGQEVPADRIPPLNGRLGLVYRVSDRLRVEPFLLFSGKQDRLSARDIDDPRINPAGTPGWGTLNIMVSYQAGEKLELGMRLENLADKAYREHGSGIDAPGINFGIWASIGF